MSIADIELRVITRDGEELDSRLFRAHRAGHLRPDTQGLLPPEMLRLGVEFADGSRVSNVMPAVRDLEVAPEGPGDGVCLASEQKRGSSVSGSCPNWPRYR
jgi:hypothetical protein